MHSFDFDLLDELLWKDEIAHSPKISAFAALVDMMLDAAIVGDDVKSDLCRLLSDPTDAELAEAEADIW